MPLPSRIRCHQGGEWKSAQEFSRRQLQKALSSPDFNPEFSGISCSVHTKGEPTLQCERCGLNLPTDSFSHNARRSEEPECRRCVAWVETQEYEVPPIPLATGAISPEETMQRAMYDSKLRSNSHFITDNDKPRAPVTALSTLGIPPPSNSSTKGSKPNSVTNTSKTAAASSSKASSNLPPHLIGAVSTNQTFANRIRESQAAQLPPHLSHAVGIGSSLGTASSNNANWEANSRNSPSVARTSDSTKQGQASESTTKWDENIKW